MGSTISSCFVDPKALPDDAFGFEQLIFLFVIYAFILFWAAKQISDGSELLLLIPQIAGVVGSVVLPVLGAVPDGAIVLFSGIGPRAQEQLSVGVGALAGSTVMLMTIPYSLAVFFGRVNLDKDGKGNYGRKLKLDPSIPFSLTAQGVNLDDSVRSNTLVMLLTCLGYFVIQAPAFYEKCGFTSQVASGDCSPQGEHSWALYGFIYCCVAFAGYLLYQFVTNPVDRSKVLLKALEYGDITFYQCVKDGLVKVEPEPLSADPKKRRGCCGGASEQTELKPLGETGYKANKVVSIILQQYFRRYDRDNSKSIDKGEIEYLIKDLLGKNTLPPKLKHKVREELDFKKFDTDGDDSISFPEFVVMMPKLLELVSDEEELSNSMNASLSKSIEGFKFGQHQDDETGDLNTVEMEQEEEEEEEPADIKDMKPSERRCAIKSRACYKMLLGTVIVLIVSDPMVDVLSSLGDRLGIPAFYVAFVLAPIASNASELVAAISYARKKTRDSASTAITQCLGAGSMNNTFCLAIFLALIYFQNLTWEFSAESISIVFIEVVVALISMRRVQTLLMAVFVFLLYGVALGLVALLESSLVGLN